MTPRVGAALVAASVVFLVLVLTAGAKLGANYEEVVAYVLLPFDIRDWQAGTPHGPPPRLVISSQLPRLAFEPAADVRLPLLNQPYMTDHLSYGGVVLAATGIDPLWAARLWHAAFGFVVLWLLYDVARQLGMSRRGGLIAVALAATSLPFTYMYTWARFDESLASWGTLTVLWAALRYRRAPRALWIWVAVITAALAVSAKLTATWPLIALAVTAWCAGWRPPPVRAMVAPLIVALPLFGPIAWLSLAGPATSNEVARRLEFINDIFTSDAIPGTAANLIDYLGNWGGILSVAMRGSADGGANLAGRAIVTATLIWLAVRALAPGPLPRRRRLESHMLLFAFVIYAFVVLFFREHRDYQFALLVPLHAVAIAAFLDWCAARLSERGAPSVAAGLFVCALPVGSNLWEQARFQGDLATARNAMFHQGVQRESARWLAAQGAHRPIVVTFYAVGTYELYSDGVVRPVYGFPLFRHKKHSGTRNDLDRMWQKLLGEGSEPRYVVLPLGENPIERQHFDEPGIRAALATVADGGPVATFANRAGEPLLEIWKVTPHPPSAVPPPVAAPPATEPASDVPPAR